MLRDLYRSLIAFLALTALCGVAYPVVVWGVGQVAFGDAADGSLIKRDGVVIGSARMGQAFAGAQWFQGRPSAYAYSGAPAGEDPVVASSGGSNLGPNAQALADAVGEALTARAELEGVAPTAVPVDLVTASGSGVDPDISLDSALLQVARVARERNLDEAAVEAMVRDHVISPSLGFLGSERVNVLRLNLALEGGA
jgi:potassium-transporting ATPase KdpC subunit